MLYTLYTSDILIHEALPFLYFCFIIITFLFYRDSSYKIQQQSRPVRWL
jgi:hypothetical protein